jgi:uncharacterized membrane protein YdjX (TVP38/TMEM64 family)
VKVRVPRASTAAAVGAVAAGVGVYLLVPGVRSGIDPAVRALSAPDARTAVEAFRAYVLGFGAWAPAVSAALMVLQAVVAPLPAFVITFANGAVFGWAWGALLSWSSATAGAALCFWIARALGRPPVERLLGGGAVLDAADRFFARYGKAAILLARLLPFVPFDAISYGAGLTSTRLGAFLVATAIGQLPATLLYSYLGESVTGSVSALFWVFSIVTALVVIGWIAGPRLLRPARARARAEGDGIP